ncbi:gliding motility protein GldB-related protein [Pedobacter sp. GR22-6]|uniref:gliding motility protein GldB-related protein n=1 Tax=Pedobacter sp. GR22-6 TaxID=3127957 RepID=UPI00307F53E6
MMKKILLIPLLSIFLVSSCFAQYVNDPLKATFVTKDITNFWNAFDQVKASTQINPFEALYIQPGSPGVQAFTPGRIESAASLLKTVLERWDDYVKIRKNSLAMLENEKQCRAAFLALKYLYPKAVYPNVYFVIGRFNSGGHSNPKGLIIGAEMVQSKDVPYMVAHELIHYQQDSIPKKNLSLLAACINEGSADFIAELISGGGPNRETHDYGNANESKLWNEFKLIMDDKEDSHDWMYNYKPKNGYPPDLGYWIGYKITEAYYNKATDKKKAISDILHIKDFYQFLSDSGYPLKFK